MAHRIAPRRLPALRNIAAGLALTVTPALLYLGVGGQAAQAATNPDWTLQAGGTTVCTTFTALSFGSTPGPGPAQSLGILSGASLGIGCSGLPGLESHNTVPETFTVSRALCSGGTPEKEQYVFGGASVIALQSTGGANSTETAKFTYQTVAITYPKLGGSC
jgi:hypothetical protein